MAWLVSDGRVLASVEVAADRKQQIRGLLRRDEVDGAFVLQPCKWIHTIGMRFALDVAYVDPEGIVLKTAAMQRHRIGVPVLKSQMIIEAQIGAFGRWGLRVGDHVEIRE